jgi:type I restriction enzyme R subunit
MSISQSKLHTEETFEIHIVEQLVAQQGYVERFPYLHYDQALALDKELLISFIKETQPTDWKHFAAKLGDTAERHFFTLFEKRLASEGVHTLLKKGVSFTNGAKFKLCFFKPASRVVPQRELNFQSNRLSVMRQVRYSTMNKNAIDLVVFLNGIPVATFELKNAMTGQSIEDAIKQYKYDRKPAGEPLLTSKRGALVHLAVDTDQAFMTTTLANGKTKFLPLNRGDNGRAGNPHDSNEFPVAHLYADVEGRSAIFSRDVLLDIIVNFAQEDRDKGEFVFPRYHQIDAVRAMASHARANGAGQNYLIQHSAGSGKTWTIAWTASAFAKLHTDDDKNVFDTVIIISDRKVLDGQLQKAIRKLGLTDGYFETVDQTSRQLKKALETGKKIVVTTIQKFCTDVIDSISQMSGRKFAVIIDEAHGSQSGKAAESMHRTLGKGGEEIDISDDDFIDGSDEVAIAIARSQRGRRPSADISYVAFTATPKNVTLERFGTRSNQFEEPRPFHLYTMRQAIEEGFIIDVLQNYTTYQSYYRLEKSIEGDPQFNTREARRKIARYVSLESVNQKAAVIVEHFRRHVQKELSGKAKAMIVTQSRHDAFRHHEAVKGYINDRGYTDLNALVAFSGSLPVDGHQYTEAEINGFAETELPEQFDGDLYQVLIVANKYQTGFDQPKICGMYIDRKLTGLQCVQTLTRANRTYDGKTAASIHILDFQNTIKDIREAFSQYFDVTTLDGLTDPDQIYGLKSKIEDAGFIESGVIDEFADIYHKGPNYTGGQRARLEGLVSRTVNNSKHASAGEQEEFGQAAKSYCRFYAFITQAFDVCDPELEKWFWYLDWLSKKLGRRKDESDTDLTDEMIRLLQFRLEQDEVGVATPELGSATALPAIKGFGVNKPALEQEEAKELSEIIASFNEKYAVNLKEENIVRIMAHEETFSKNPDNSVWIDNNPVDLIAEKFRDGLLDYVIEQANHERSLDELFSNDLDTWGQLANLMLRMRKRQATSLVQKTADWNFMGDKQ